MSGTATRTSKRQIRKALGPEVLQVLADHEDALTHHTEQLRELRANDVALSDASGKGHLAIERIDATSRFLSREMCDMSRRLSARLPDPDCSVIGRLKWLLTGR